MAKKQTLSNTLKKKAMLKALEECRGIVFRACKKVGIVRSTYYEWIKKDEEFKQAVEDINEISLDLSEESLGRQIDDDNTTATIFHLKTKGRGRGYIEKVDQNITIEKANLPEWMFDDDEES